MKRALATPLAVVLALAASVAWAQPAAQSDEERKQAARELANKGYEHYEAGEYGRAILYFRDAEAKFHAPTLLLVQAHAHVKLGQLVEARALYQRIVDEKLPDDAPKEFLDAQVAAQKQVELATAKIATLKIVFKGMAADKVTVTIDDVEIPTAQVLQPIPQNPGNHKIVATLGSEEGGRQVYQAVTLNPGTTKTVQLVFRKGGPVETPPTSGGCASCEIGARRGGGGELHAASSAAVVALLTALRRRRRRPRTEG